MDGNTELLNYIYQNSAMGVTSIKKLMESVSEPSFKSELECELSEYTRIHLAAKELINRRGESEKGLSFMEKTGTDMMIDMKTMNDKSNSHIAEMLLKGGIMGIIDVIKNLRKYNDAAPEIIELANQLLQSEEAGEQRLKAFL